MKIFRVDGVTISVQNTEVPPYFNSAWSSDLTEIQKKYESVTAEDFTRQMERPSETMKGVFGFEKRIITAHTDADTFSRISAAASIDEADSFLGFNFQELESDVIQIKKQTPK